MHVSLLVYLTYLNQGHRWTVSPLHAHQLVGRESQQGTENLPTTPGHVRVDELRETVADVIVQEFSDGVCVLLKYKKIDKDRR